MRGVGSRPAGQRRSPLLFIPRVQGPARRLRSLRKKKKKKSTRRVGKTATVLDSVVWAGQDSSGMDGDIEKFTLPADITLGYTHTLWSESHACDGPALCIKFSLSPQTPMR